MAEEKGQTKEDKKMEKEEEKEVMNFFLIRYIPIYFLNYFICQMSRSDSMPSLETPSPTKTQDSQSQSSDEDEEDVFRKWFNSIFRVSPGLWHVFNFSIFWCVTCCELIKNRNY